MTALAQERVCMGDGKHGYRDSGRRSGGVGHGLALARRGHEPRVYERRPAPATMGAGVTLWPNAGFVLADLELLDEVLALGGTPAAMHRYDAQGRSLGGLDIEPLDRLMGYPTCAILRTDPQAVLLRRAREAGVPVAFGREATAIANDPDGRAVVHFADGGRLSPDLVIGADGRMSSVARAHAGRRQSRLRQLDRRGRKLARPGGRRCHPRLLGAWRARRHRGAGAAQGLWAGAQAQTLEQARVGGRRAGRRVAQGAPPVRAGPIPSARSSMPRRRGPAPDRGATWSRWPVGIAAMCCWWATPRTRAHVGAGRLPGAGGCLASGALPGGSGHGAGRGTGAGAGTVRRIAAGEDGGHHTAGAVLRASCSSRTRRLAASATRACAPAIRCKACMRWRKAGGGPAFAGAGAGRSRAATVAGSGAGR